MYALNKSFIYQRHYDIDRTMSLYDYVVANMNNGKEFDDTYYVVANADHVYEINLIGSLIIEEIKKGLPIEEIVKNLMTIYAVSFEQLKEDVIAFIEYLRGINIVNDEKTE